MFLFLILLEGKQLEHEDKGSLPTSPGLLTPLQKSWRSCQGSVAATSLCTQANDKENGTVAGWSVWMSSRPVGRQLGLHFLLSTAPQSCFTKPHGKAISGWAVCLSPHDVSLSALKGYLDHTSSGLGEGVMDTGYSSPYDLPFNSERLPAKYMQV